MCKIKLVAALIMVGSFCAMPMALYASASDSCGVDLSDIDIVVNTTASSAIIGEEGTFYVGAGDLLMEQGKPVVVLFSTTWCPHCVWVNETFNAMVREYVSTGQIVAYHWECDLGDDILSPERETQVPEKWMDMLRSYSPAGNIPLLVIGGKYWRIGNGYELQDDRNAEEAELRALIEKVLQTDGSTFFEEPFPYEVTEDFIQPDVGVIQVPGKEPAVQQVPDSTPVPAVDLSLPEISVTTLGMIVVVVMLLCFVYIAQKKITIRLVRQYASVSHFGKKGLCMLITILFISSAFSVPGLVVVPDAESQNKTGVVEGSPLDSIQHTDQGGAADRRDEINSTDITADQEAFTEVNLGDSDTNQIGSDVETTGDVLDAESNPRLISYPINHCNTTLWSSARYYLTGDLTYSSGNCISIRTDDVIIDGMGYSINGLGTGSSAIIDTLAYDVRYKNITIQNLTITGAASDAIHFFHPTAKVTLVDVTIMSNDGVGVHFEDTYQSHIVNNTIMNNGGDGVEIISQTLNQLIPADERGSYFGTSVSLSGDTALVGCGDRVVYVFKNTSTGWSQEPPLTASDVVYNDGFGYSVALDGDTALIGSYLDDDKGTNSGSAYVFIRTDNGWVLQQKLLAVDGQSGDQFGHSVALDGDTALIGAHYDDDLGSFAGSAYIFTRTGTTWTQQAKLLASDGAADDIFGESVSLSGDTALIGAYGDDTNKGAAYVFTGTGTTWTEQQKILALDGSSGDKFGISVSLAGDTALIGAPFDDDLGSEAGAAYVFTRSGSSWTQQQKLTAFDYYGAVYAWDYFGTSVSLSGDTALIGAFGDDDNGDRSGSAYTFIRSGSTWTQQAKLLASDGAAMDDFGGAVSLSGDTALIGALYNDFNGVNTGSSYIYTRTDTEWTQHCPYSRTALNQIEHNEITTNVGAAVSLMGYTTYNDISNNSIIGNDGAGIKVEDGYYTEVSGNTIVDNGFHGILGHSISGFSEHIDKILASDGQAGDWFAHSVSLSGETALIGMYGDDDYGSESGSALVFIHDGTNWILQAKLHASDAEAGDGFGYSVSLEGDTALIGAPNDDTLGGGDAGSAYIFTRIGTTWTEQQKILSSDGVAQDYFGNSVSLDRNTALIGAYCDDDKGGNSGSAYVFTFTGSTWTEQDKLIASDGAESDLFGGTVSLSGDTALIGAGLHDEMGIDSGSAYIFTRTGEMWTQQQQLLLPEGASYDYFGNSVSLDGDTALIGAFNDDDKGLNSGSAYVFTNTGGTWSPQATLLASDGTAHDWFGYAVSLDGDTALIGSLGDDDSGESSGSAYLYTHTGTTWTQKESKLIASDGAAMDWFGHTVAVSGDTALIGATYDDDNGGDSGSAYLFTTRASSLIKNNTISGNDGNGIVVSESSYIQISSNAIDNNYDGITLSGSDSIDIHDNAINDNGGNGIALEGEGTGDCTSIFIIDNEIQNHPHYGITFQGYESFSYDYFVIKNNIISGNGGFEYGGGVNLWYSQYSTVSCNTISNNYGNVLYLYEGDHKRIENNTIDGNSGTGLDIVGISNISIVKNTISWNTGHGIYLGHEWEYNQNIEIMDNTVTSNGYEGMFLSYCDDVVIDGNIISENLDDGIYQESCGEVSIRNNTISSNWRGIVSFYGYETYVSNNEIMWNEDGVVFSSEPNMKGETRDQGPTTIIDNVIANNTNTGIHISWEAAVIIESNTIQHNMYGILLDEISEYSTGNVVTENYVLNNSIGIQVVHNEEEWITIYNNVFINDFNAIDNGFDIWNISKTNESNIFGGPYTGGNFWGDYTGLDNGSGVGVHAVAGDYLGDTEVPYTCYGNIMIGGDDLPLLKPPVWCGMTITENFTLPADILNCRQGNGINIEGDNIVLNGNNHTVSGVPGSNFGIYVQGNTNVAIHNVKVSGYHVGILLDDVSGSSLSANTIKDCYTGINLIDAEHNTIQNTNIVDENFFAGLQLDASFDNTFENMVLDGNGVGLYFSDPVSYDNIFDSIIVNGDVYYHIFNQTGVILPQGLSLKGAAASNLGKISIINSSYIELQTGEFSNNSNGGSGVFIYNSHHVTVGSLTTEYNTYGVRVVSSHDITLPSDDVHYNYYGVALQYTQASTVTDVSATHNNYAVYLDASSENLVSGGIIQMNNNGLYLTASSQNTFSAVDTIDNYYGFSFTDHSDDNTLTSVDSLYDKIGVSFSTSSGNELHQGTIRDAYLLYFRSTQNSYNTATNVTINTTRSSFDSKDISINNVINPPGDENGLLFGVDEFLDLRKNSDDGYITMQMYYEEDTLGAIIEETLGLYKYDADRWVLSPGSTVNTQENYVSATITTFSIYGILGITQPIRVVYKDASPCHVGMSYHTTVKSAVDAANPNDIILLCPSTNYIENPITVDTTVSIRPFGDTDETILKFDNNQPGTWPLFYITAPDVNITGLTITEFNPAVIDNAAIVDVGVGTILTQNEFTIDYAISKIGGSNSLIADNVIHDSSKGAIGLANTHHVTISGNKLTNNVKGIELTNSHNNTLSHNKLTKSPLFFSNADFNTVSNNSIGYKTFITKFFVNDSDHNVVEHNAFYRTTLTLRYSGHSIIKWNTFIGDVGEKVGQINLTRYCDYTFIYNNKMSNGSYAINAFMSSHIWIYNNNISHYYWQGIFVNNSFNPEIRGNEIDHCWRGIIVHTANGAYIEGNLVRYSNRSNIMVNNCWLCNISGNSVSFGQHGLNLNNTRKAMVYYNQVSHNDQGGIVLEYHSYEVTISNNTVVHNGLVGVFLNDSWSNRIVFNQILDNNERGIELNGSSNNLITDNSIGNNTVRFGILIRNASRYNEFYRNLIFNNKQHGVYISDYHSYGNIIAINFFGGNNIGEQLQGRQAYEEGTASPRPRNMWNTSHWPCITHGWGNYWSDRCPFSNPYCTPHQNIIMGNASSFDYYPLQYPLIPPGCLPQPPKFPFDFIETLRLLELTSDLITQEIEIQTVDRFGNLIPIQGVPYQGIEVTPEPKLTFITPPIIISDPLGKARMVVQMNRHFKADENATLEIRCGDEFHEVIIHPYVEYPVINKVEPYYVNYFLKDYPLENPHWIRVNWRGTLHPEQLIVEPENYLLDPIIVPKENIIKPVSCESNNNVSIWMNNFSSPGLYPVEITAISDDTTSNRTGTYFTIMRRPPSQFNFPTYNQVSVEYPDTPEHEIVYSNNTGNLAWGAVQGVLGDEVTNLIDKVDFTIPSAVPFFGGHYGIDTSRVLVTRSLSFNTLDGTIKRSMDGRFAFDFGKTSLDTTIGQTTFLRPKNSDFENLQKIFALALLFEYSQHIQIGPIPFKLEINADLSTTITKDWKEGEWKFSKFDFKIDASGKVSLSIEIFEVGALAGLRVKGTYENSQFKMKELDVYLGVTFDWDIEIYTFHWGKKFVCNLWPIISGNPPDCWWEDASKPEGWRLRERDYVNENYSRFVGNLGISHSSPTTETMLLQNVYPNAHPQLALNTQNDQQMVVYTHDNISKNLTQAMEIHAMRWDGEHWAQPTPLTTNLKLDMNPDVVYDSQGNAMAVWELINNESITNTTNINDTIRYAEIAYAQYNAAQDEWSAPLLLTNNSFYDHEPTIAAGSNGTIMAMWYADEDNTIDIGLNTIGYNATLRPYDMTQTIYYSLWDGDSWSTPAVAFHDIPLAHKFSFDFTGDKATAVWNQDLDGNSSTRTDREIMSATWDGTSWSPPTQLTSNSIEDAFPTIVYDQQQKILAWKTIQTQENNTIATLQYAIWDAGAWSQPEQIPSIGQIDQLLLTKNPSQNTVLIWQNAQDQATDVFYAVYDKNHASWSVPNQLTNDTITDFDYSPVIDSQNNLISSYVKQESIPVTETHTTGNHTYNSTVNYPGNASIWVLHHHIFTDVAIQDTDITVSDPRLTPGTTVLVNATIRNIGDLSVDDLSVRVSDGYPGVEIGTSQISLLRAGESTTISVPWMIPQDHQIQNIFVDVDYLQDIAEDNETNNLGELQLMLPDLTTQYVSIQEGNGATFINSRIANIGRVSSSPVNVGVYYSAFSEEQTQVASLSLPALAPGEEHDINVAFDANGTIPIGYYTVVVVVDPEHLMPELNETNNEQEALLRMFSDVAALNLSVPTLLEGPVPFTMNVSNTGKYDVQNLTVQVYKQSPYVSDESGDVYNESLLILNQTIPLLPAYTTTTVSGLWDAAPGSYTLYGLVDPYDIIPETDEFNNLQAVDVIIQQKMNLTSLQAADTDADGINDAIVAAVQANITQEESYLLSGTLQNGITLNGGSYIYLSPGVQTLNLSFPTYDIVTQGISGIFSLHNVTLRYNTDIIGRLIGQYTTPYYNYTDFEQVPIELDNTYSDTGIDIDADGLYNTLRVDVGCDVIEDGIYTITGVLSNSSGGFIDFASVSANVSTGSAVVSLDFDGFTIRMKEANGPYTLKALHIYDDHGNTLIEASNVYTTQYYEYTQFEDTTFADNVVPEIYFVMPLYAASHINRPPTELNFTVEDANDDALDLSVRWMNHQHQWVTLQTFTGVTSGMYGFIPPTTNDWIWGNTTYLWSINVTDGVEWVNKTYYYTTKGSRYDISNNNVVNFQDAGLVWVHRTSIAYYDALYDVNANGVVNFQDAGLVWVNRD